MEVTYMYRAARVGPGTPRDVFEKMLKQTEMRGEQKCAQILLMCAAMRYFGSSTDDIYAYIRNVVFSMCPARGINATMVRRCNMYLNFSMNAFDAGILGENRVALTDAITGLFGFSAKKTQKTMMDIVVAKGRNVLGARLSEYGRNADIVSQLCMFAGLLDTFSTGVASFVSSHFDEAMKIFKAADSKFPAATGDDDPKESLTGELKEYKIVPSELSELIEAKIRAINVQEEDIDAAEAADRNDDIVNARVRRMYEFIISCVFVNMYPAVCVAAGSSFYTIPGQTDDSKVCRSPCSYVVGLTREQDAELYELQMKIQCGAVSSIMANQSELDKRIRSAMDSSIYGKTSADRSLPGDIEIDVEKFDIKINGNSVSFESSRDPFVQSEMKSKELGSKDTATGFTAKIRINLPDPIYLNEEKATEVVANVIKPYIDKIPASGAGLSESDYNNVAYSAYVIDRWVEEIKKRFPGAVESVGGNTFSTKFSGVAKPIIPFGANWAIITSRAERFNFKSKTSGAAGAAPK